jgi:low affinity Fe/Cu permease
MPAGAPDSVSPRLGPFSSILHAVGDLTSRSGVALTMAAAVVLFLVALVRAGAPQEWQVAFATGASAVTLVMVFVLQHTQSRQQLATQLKLDELIRTSPRADDLLVHVESADDDELRSIERDQLDHHSNVRGGQR